MQLRVVARRDVGEFSMVDISVVEGHLVIDCDDEPTINEIARVLAQQFFVENQGFPVYRKDPETGAIERDPRDGKPILMAYVDLEHSEELVLRAIRENFLVDGTYQVMEVLDGEDGDEDEGAGV